jgi:ribosomal protein S18 acetylase RimI-like enzyme
MALLPDRASATAAPQGFDVRVAKDELELAQFSDVQSRGFLSLGNNLESLHAFLHGANQKNLNHPAQTFYIGYLNGRPIAVTLLLIHERTAGICAVATLPDFRRRGFSRVLLARAIADARERHCDTLTLQVHRDSDAERLYSHLSFAVEFDCTLWNKKDPISRKQEQGK